LNQINDVFYHAGVQWAVSLTQKSGDAARFARQAIADGAEVVSAYGGDGTVMEVAEGVAGAAFDLPENNSAAVALFEHLWSLGLQQAVQTAGGQMHDSGFIHPPTQSEVIAEEMQKVWSSTGHTQCDKAPMTL